MSKKRHVLNRPKMPYIPVGAFDHGRIDTNVTAHGGSIMPCKYLKINNFTNDDVSKYLKALDGFEKRSRKSKTMQIEIKGKHNERIRQRQNRT